MVSHSSVVLPCACVAGILCPPHPASCWACTTRNNNNNQQQQQQQEQQEQMQQRQQSRRQVVVPAQGQADSRH
jgi:hypothetical protein